MSPIEHQFTHTHTLILKMSAPTVCALMHTKFEGNLTWGIKMHLLSALILKCLKSLAEKNKSLEV